MTTYTVTTFNDELDSDLSDLGDLSLREALVLASQNPGADTITFATGGQITLNPNLPGPAPGQGHLYIGEDVTIDGDLDNDGTPDITIDGSNATRIFFVYSGTATLEGLTLQHPVTNATTIAYDGANTVTLNGVALASLTAGNFLFA